jgi:hypothetical protein
MSSAEEVHIRVLVTSNGEQAYDVLIGYTANVAALRKEIGQSGFALVDSRTGNVLDDSVLLGGLVDSAGEVRLEMLPMAVEVVNAAAGRKGRKGSGSGSRPSAKSANAGTTAVTILAVIGGLTLAFVAWKIYSWFRAKKSAQLTQDVPANAQGAEKASAPPQAATK